MDKNISISVVIPTFNRPLSYLKSAVESVLLQTFKPIEIIVVDDNYEPLLCKRIELFCFDNKIKYIHNEGDHGACEARNLGIKNATGEYIAFLDDDDVWLPTKLEMQVQIITDKVVMIYCNGWRIDERTIPKTVSEYRNSENFLTHVTFEQLLDKNHIGTTTQFLVKKSTLKEIEGFDEELPARQDYDLCLRLSMCGEIIGVNKHLFIHYLHFGEQISKSSDFSLVAYKRLYAKFKNYYGLQKNAKSNLLFKIARMERLQKHYFNSVAYFFKGFICSPYKLKTGIRELKKDTPV